jgi:sterol desaturase/sphingolipid hydroxylase (fatty acid hydroxylase superfamily)
MILLERLFPLTKNVKLFRKGFWMDLIWYTFIQSFLLQILIFDWIIEPLKIHFGLENSGILSSWNFYLLIILFFISHDFYIYCFHRLQHNNKWLWRTHEAHHSVREVDWLAGSRSHFIEIIINQTVEFLPIFFLLDVKTASYLVPIKALIDSMWGMWIHANVNVNSGKLQYFINGPEMHQWHHGNHEEVFYKNYSTKLAIWDWIFGTGFLPGLKPLQFNFSKPLVFGLPYAYPSDFFTQSVYALFRFDFKNLEQKKWYYQLQHLRSTLTQKTLGIFGAKQKWIKEELFDEANNRYAIDEAPSKCSKCGRTTKYFMRGDRLVYICEECEHHPKNLAKF